MAVEFTRARPGDVRDRVIDFFWRMRAWPYETREQYERYWDWRYTSLSEEEPVVWIASENADVVGHIAVYFRRYALAGRDMRVGVPGNFLVAPSHRDTLVGARLGAAPRALVQKREIDLMLAYANQIAHAMFIRLGFRDLGPMRTYVEVRRSAPAVARRYPTFRRLAPGVGALVDALLRARRAAYETFQGPVRGISATFERSLPLNAERPGWHGTTALVERPSARYVQSRFLDHPFEPKTGVALRDDRTGRLVGMVIIEPGRRAKIWQCDVDESRLSAPQAVMLALALLPGVETVTVPLRPATALARQFVRAGFLQHIDEGFVEQASAWSALWLPDHPLASELTAVTEWQLWYGSTHH